MYKNAKKKKKMPLVYITFLNHEMWRFGKMLKHTPDCTTFNIYNWNKYIWWIKKNVYISKKNVYKWVFWLFFTITYKHWPTRMVMCLLTNSLLKIAMILAKQTDGMILIATFL